MSSKKYIKIDSSDCIEECKVCPYNVGGLWGNCIEINDFYAKQAEEDLSFLLDKNGKFTQEYLYFCQQNRMTLVED